MLAIPLMKADSACDNVAIRCQCLQLPCSTCNVKSNHAPNSHNCSCAATRCYQLTVTALCSCSMAWTLLWSVGGSRCSQDQEACRLHQPALHALLCEANRLLQHLQLGPAITECILDVIGCLLGPLQVEFAPNFLQDLTWEGNKGCGCGQRVWWCWVGLQQPRVGCSCRMWTNNFDWDAATWCSASVLNCSKIYSRAGCSLRP